jgi:hypothetical protein
VIEVAYVLVSRALLDCLLVVTGRMKGIRVFGMCVLFLSVCVLRQLSASIIRTLYAGGACHILRCGLYLHYKVLLGV